MKRLAKISFLFLTALLYLSCGEDRTYQFIEITEENQWIYSHMKEHYLWSDSIKEPSRSVFFSKSEQFYKGLLQKNDNTSFFNDSVATTSYGFSYIVMRDPLGIQSSKIYALVTYVEPKSPADKAGLTRGMWITGTKEKDVTTSNHTMLINGNASTLYTTKITFDGEKDKYIWCTNDTLQIEAAVSYNALSIPLDTIYNNNNTKTGYIVMNNFGGKESSESITTSFTHLAEEQVNSLIIDLRYNNETTLQQAVEFANLLAQTADAGKPFCTINKNNHQTETFVFEPAPLLHSIDRIFFLTSSATHTVAQLFISALQHTVKAENITVIGEKADCQPYITETFVSPYGFSISPTVATLYTANGNMLSSNSVSIQYEINEFEDITNIYPLGDKREVLLNKALTIIEN